jgi:hypothetical protein
MTRSRSNRHWPLLALISVAGLFLLGGAAQGEDGGEGGYARTPWDVEIISAKIGGKNVFIPSTVVVTSEGDATLSIFNTTDAPHGFAIDELGIKEVIPVQKETKIHLPKLEPNQVLKIYCHLHPPHRSATLVVLPGVQKQD